MYSTTRRRPLKRRVVRRPPVVYYTSPQQRGRIRSERIAPYQISRRRRFTVRTHTGQVLLFLIILGVIGWYSGLIPMGMAKLAAAMTPSIGPVPQTALVYPGQHSIQGAPTISAAKIDSILCSAGSPACGSGQEIYHLGVIYNINPAYALAFFQHESSFGLAGAARYTHSLGNLRCIPNYPCPDGYASFPTWSEGFQAWYVLIDSNVYVRSGHTSIETIIPVYAPSGDNNDVNAYINSVVGAVESWEK
jgi:hypothetical protein